ncbi:MAG: PilW family protein [Cocleimonas sp.]|nr:PilW family protein [Cocleimonas sp.]
MKTIMNKINNNAPKKQQAGLSLIELLIAMLIGLFLLTGIATSYLSSKKNSNTRDELTTLEDNGRLALEVLSGVLEHTGYTPINAGILNPPFITNDTQVVSAACGAGNSVEGIGNFATRITKDGALDGTTGDAITVMYNADNRVFTDCSGGQLPVACQASPAGAAAGTPSVATRIYNAFYLDSGELRCAGSRDSSVQVIADGVENMQFMYGLDTTDDGRVDKYVNASNVGAFWNSVVSVQVAILVSSNKNVKAQNEQITYTLLDQSVTAPDDRKQRAVFTTTVRIRNTL